MWASSELDTKEVWQMSQSKVSFMSVSSSCSLFVERIGSSSFTFLADTASSEESFLL
jgi:hypothetical protein